MAELGKMSAGSSSSRTRGHGAPLLPCTQNTVACQFPKACLTSPGPASLVRTLLSVAFLMAEDGGREGCHCALRMQSGMLSN